MSGSHRPKMGEVHATLAAAREHLIARDRDTIRSQVRVTQIAAPTGREQRRAAWIARRLRTLDLPHVAIDSAGNVIARRDGTTADPPVVVCAHLDTVFPADQKLDVLRDGERFVGPGIGDNSRGLAAMLALASALQATRTVTRRPIDFVATTCEEGAGDLRGAKHLFGSSHSGAAAAVVLDGAGDRRIVHSAIGSRRYRITYRGTGGHSWSAFGTPNPVHAAGSAAATLARIPLARSPRTTLSVARIGGGIAVNAIADEAWLELDLRSTSAHMIALLDLEVREVVIRAAEDENARRVTGSDAMRCEVEVIGDRPSGETPQDEPLVAAALEATRAVGLEPELAAASTDANIPISHGIPAVAIGGGGSGGDAHTPSEWYDNRNGVLGIARALTLVVAAASV